MLRDYQETLLAEVHSAFDEQEGHVIAVAPCGAGKTVIMAHEAKNQTDPNIAIAHRRELVWQISAAFAQAGLYHRIVAPESVITSVCKMHMERFGERFYRKDADVAVASVDAMIRRLDDPFFAACRRWQTDEAHHLQPDNKWGRAAAMCSQARGIGWSATPVRADRRPLKSVFGRMVIGPTVRNLIDRGYLADYRIYGLPKAIDTTNVRIAANGDFNAVDLSGAAHASAITGDIVQTYLKYAAGLSGVTFAVDVGLAEEHAQAFRDAGVRAAVLSNETKDGDRVEMIRAYRAKELDQIVNVDILGEGFDCPGIQVASLGRPTMSLPLCIQQMMRPMRPDGEKVALILDHVGNVIMHGLPDTARAWTLDVPDRKKGVARLEVVVRVCPACLQPYEGFEPKCPFCGAERDRPERNRPEAVEGDLTLYSPELLAALRGEVARIAGPEQIPYGLDGNAAIGAVKQWNNRQDAQAALSTAIDLWAGQYAARGESTRAIYMRFFATFGMDTLSALSQPGPKMWEMIRTVEASLR
jgi:DNA repair protein RadD